MLMLNLTTVVEEHPIPKTEHASNKINCACSFYHLYIIDATHFLIGKEFNNTLTLKTLTHGKLSNTCKCKYSYNLTMPYEICAVRYSKCVELLR